MNAIHALSQLSYSPGMNCNDYQKAFPLSISNLGKRRPPGLTSRRPAFYNEWIETIAAEGKEPR